MTRLPKLRLIATRSIGYIDIRYCAEHDIKVSQRKYRLRACANAAAISYRLRSPGARAFRLILATAKARSIPRAAANITAFLDGKPRGRRMVAVV